MKIGSVNLPSPFAIAPMAGMTDTAFRRLVKRHGGCGLVVTEMVSSEGLVRGIGRTLEYAEYTEEERPVSIQIFGGDPAKMAAAAEIVEELKPLGSESIKKVLMKHGIQEPLCPQTVFQARVSLLPALNCVDEPARDPADGIHSAIGVCIVAFGFNRLESFRISCAEK